MKLKNDLIVCYKKYGRISLMVTSLMVILWLSSLPSSATVNLSSNIQMITLLIFILSLMYSMQSRIASLRIPLLEYRLKLFSELKLRMYIIAKVSLYSLLLAATITNSHFYTGIYLQFFYFIFLADNIFITISRSKRILEIVVVILYASSIFIGVPYLTLWIIYSLIYVYTKLVRLDFNNFLIVSYMKSSAFQKRPDAHVASFEIPPTTRRTKTIQLDTQKAYFQYKFLSLRMLNFWYIVIGSIAVLLLLEFNLFHYFNHLYILYVVLISPTLIDKLNRQEWSFIKYKAYPIPLLQENLKINYLVYTLNMTLYMIIAIFLGSYINTPYTIISIMAISALYIIKDHYFHDYKKFSFVFELIITSIVFLLLP